MAQSSRPVYLNLLKIRLPLPGWVSILHRVSGVLLFLLLPLLLWLLSCSLAFQASFTDLQQSFQQHGWLRLVVWVCLSLLVYHLIAGIRHLIMDLGIGDSLAGGRRGAYIVLFIAAVLIVWLGAYLW